MEVFKIDWKLNRNEVKEVASYTKEKIAILLETDNEFKKFINVEYKSANENYLWGRNWVKKLQRALWFTWKDLDWYFGKNTFFAVVEFQRSHGLVPDWLVWPKTQKEVFKSNNILAAHIKNRKKAEKKENVKTKESISTNNNVASFSKYIDSLPAEKKWNMTYCSRTARKNLYRLWIDRKDVPHWPSALDSMKLYTTDRYDDISEIPSDSNVVDLFIDTKSRYEHRAAAYLKWWEWFVLDPYFWNNSTSPIPISKYLSTKKVLWIYPHVSTKVA